jgi:hypothetical protein
MKKVYLVGAMLIAGLGAKAQVQTYQNMQVVKQLPMYSVANESDTLGLLEFGEQAVLYTDIGGSGYIFGTSSLTETVDSPLGPLEIKQSTFEVAAGFLVNSGYSVKGALMLVGEKSNPSGEDRNLNLKVYSLGENAALGSAQSEAADAEGPVTALRTQAFPFSDIQVDDAAILSTIILLDQPVFSPTDFAIAVDLGPLYTGTVDTVALFVNQPSPNNSPEYGWLRLNAAPQNLPLPAQNFWVNLNVFDISVQIAIFAIVEESVGIEEAGFINGVKLNTYPNPALTSDNVRIDYTLENNAKAVEVTIFDMNGRLVQRFEEGSRIAGVHTVNVPAGMLSSGSYIYAITADNSRIAKRMEVVR